MTNEKSLLEYQKDMMEIMSKQAQQISTLAANYTNMAKDIDEIKRTLDGYAKPVWEIERLEKKVANLEKEQEVLVTANQTHEVFKKIILKAFVGMSALATIASTLGVIDYVKLIGLH